MSSIGSDKTRCRRWRGTLCPEYGQRIGGTVAATAQSGVSRDLASARPIHSGRASLCCARPGLSRSCPITPRPD